MAKIKNMNNAIYHFKGAIHVGYKGILTFYKTKKFKVDSGWNGDVYLEHKGTIIAKFYFADDIPYIRLSGETPYEIIMCRKILHSLGNSTEYDGGTVIISIAQQYRAIMAGEI